MIKIKFLFILTIYKDGGIEKVFDRIAESLIRNVDYEVFLFVINGNEKKIPNGVKLIKRYKDLFYLKNQFESVINFSSDWKSSLIT